MFRLSRFRRLPAAIFMAVYLSLTGFYLVQHLLGDSLGHWIGYFWTWDMFPNYPTVSVRRWAVGETASGRFVRLAPYSGHRFRWGVKGDVTRLDLDRRLPYFRLAALEGIRRHNAAIPADPIRHVYLAEQYWPEKYNLPDGLYRDFYEDTATGQPYWTSSGEDAGTVPRRKYWRILDEAAVTADGAVPAWESSP